MKKIFSFVIVLAAVAMVSCGGNNASKPAEAQAAEQCCGECAEKAEGCCGECAEKAEGACEKECCKKAAEGACEKECCQEKAE